MTRVKKTGVNTFRRAAHCPAQNTVPGWVIHPSATMAAE